MAVLSSDPATHQMETCNGSHDRHAGTSATKGRGMNSVAMHHTGLKAPFLIILASSMDRLIPRDEVNARTDDVTYPIRHHPNQQ